MSIVEYSDAISDTMLSAPRQAVLLAGCAAFRSTDGMTQFVAPRDRTHCPKGHPYDAANTVLRPNGSRRCAACRAAESAVKKACPTCGALIFRRAFGQHLQREAEVAAGIMPKNGKWRPTRTEFPWERVDRTGECWTWTGSTRDGYGKVKFNGVSITAHRLSWTLANGPIPDGLWVLHRCDNPPCVRPDHLYLGDHAQNMADMARRGRARQGDRTRARDLLADGERSDG